jgi:hypothetical protein
MPTPPRPSQTSAGVESRGGSDLLKALMQNFFENAPDLYDQVRSTLEEDAAGQEEQVALSEVLGNRDRAGVERITVEHLRALDAHHRETTVGAYKSIGLRGVPRWLYDAHTQAQLELREWHSARNLPLPDDEADPGEPDASESAIEFPRPSPATPFQRTVEYLKCRSSVVYFIDNYCSLRHKVHGVIPFRLWRWQAWLLYRWRANTRVVNLKARQIGVSEMAAGYALHLTRFCDTKSTLLLSIGQDQAQVLLGRAKTMAAYLPNWLLPGDAKNLNANGPDSVILSSDNSTRFALAHLDRQGRAHESSIESLPATERQGRSLTAALVVLDELAEMEWGRQIWQAVEPTAEGGGQVLAISTAHGRANVMYDLYSAALEGVNGFLPIFLSWRRHPERDQAWYETKKRAAEFTNELPKLHQEYPSDALEAFVQSARQVFDNSVLARHSQRIKDEIAARAAEGAPAWAEVEGLTLYEEPDAAHDYILSADVAEGRETGDYSDASVVCRQTGRECASLRGHWPMEVFAQKLDELGYRFNQALLAVEKNNHGHAVLLALTSGIAHERWSGARIAYPKLYHYKPENAPGIRQRAEPGWVTTSRTKPLMIDSLLRGLRDEVYFPREQRFLREATDFEMDERGSMGAPDGRNDDMVMSRAIGAHLLLLPDARAHTLAFIREYNDRVQATLSGKPLESAPENVVDAAPAETPAAESEAEPIVA